MRLVIAFRAALRACAERKLKNTFAFTSFNGVFAELISSVRSGPVIHERPPVGGLLCIGVTRFELMTFCSQSRRSTRLSYTPSESKYSNKSVEVECERG